MREDLFEMLYKLQLEIPLTTNYTDKRFREVFIGCIYNVSTYMDTELPKLYILVYESCVIYD